MRAPTKLSLIVGGAVATLAVTGVPAQASTAHHTIRVHPGTGTVTAAVAMAHPGDTLKLDAGTFYDSVFIPITLTVRGAGWSKTVMKPPATSDNICNEPDSISGICVLGAVDDQFNPDLSHPVRNVTISDLRLTGFSSDGIIGFNTANLKVTDVRSDHNAGYGIARFVSTGTRFTDNWTSYNTEAGLYLGDSPHADSIVRDNSTDHNGFGIFLRDSTEIKASGNKVWGNCIGIFALNTGGEAPGDLPAGNYRIQHNRVFANNAACPAGEDGPPTSGIGIALAGVHDTVVSKNDVFANKPTGPSLISGGIVILSTAPFGGADPTNNTIRGNELRGNQPADINSDGTGTGNQVSGNDCRTAIPANLGWCDATHH